jgi:hypothetical protein
MGLAIAVGMLVPMVWFVLRRLVTDRREQPFDQPLVAPPVAMPRPPAAMRLPPVASIDQVLVEPRPPTDATIDRVSDEIIDWIECARRGEVSPVVAVDPFNDAPDPDAFAENVPTVADDDDGFALVRHAAAVQRARVRN